MKTGNELVMHFLKDMYYAEKAVLKLFPELVAAAQNESLKKVFETHTEATKSQLKRLESVFKSLGQPVEAVTCEAMVGLIQETDDVIKSTAGPGAIRDAALIACVKAIEHYEIARYGSLAMWLQFMGQTEAADLLRPSMKEDSETDTQLSDIISKQMAQVLGKA